MRKLLLARKILQTIDLTTHGEIRGWFHQTVASNIEMHVRLGDVAAEFRWTSVSRGEHELVRRSQPPSLGESDLSQQGSAKRKN